MSEQDYEGFFLSPEGKRNPELELKATLRSFFSPAEARDPASGLHPQCRFPARLAWFKRELVSSSLFPEVSCPRVENWLKSLDVARITLVFPSSRVDLPASMFGHTLLRLDKRNRKGGNLFNYAVNFAADVDLNEENPLKYTVLGIFGGYDGYFGLFPYHLKVREYEDFELRDLWEYDLRLEAEEIERLMLHLWEMRFARFDYFFFKENCSYHLLSLLEAARPSLRLREHFHFWTIPADTVKLLRRQPDLVGEVAYRKSKFNRVIQRIELLDENELESFYRFDEGKIGVESAEFSSYPKSSQARILDAYIGYSEIGDESSDLAGKQRILRYRAGLGEPSPTLEEVRFTEPPETGHETSKASLAFGSVGQEQAFAELSLRPAYHDALDYGRGYEPGATVIFGELKVRNYEREGLALEAFNVLRVENYGTRKPKGSPPKFNWTAGAGVATAKTKGKLTENVLFLEGFLGWGESFGRIGVHSGLDLSLLAGDVYREGYRAGYAPKLTLIAKPDERWGALLEVAGFRYPAGDAERYGKAKLVAHYGTVDYNLRLNALYVDEHREVSLEAGFYF